MNKEDLKQNSDPNTSYLVDESDEGTDSVKHPKESHVTPQDSSTPSIANTPSPDPAGYESPYLHPDLSKDETAIVKNAGGTTSSPVNTAPTTIPLSDPSSIPTSQNPTMPSSPEKIPVQPTVQTKYVEVAKVKKGGGILSYIFWKIFNCVGCLLLIISLAIVAFVVWIINF